MTNILSNTPLLVGIVMVAIWVLRKLAPKVPSKYAPWVALTLGVLGSMVGADTYALTGQTLVDGALTGLASAGLWDATKSLHKE